MQLLRTIRLLWTFYRSYLLASFAVTAICLWLFWNHGFSIFTALFWLKVATLGVIYYFINSYKKEEYYYYQNLGVSKPLLWTITLTFDFLLFLFLIIQAYKFR